MISTLEVSCCSLAELLKTESVIMATSVFVVNLRGGGIPNVLDATPPRTSRAQARPRHATSAYISLNQLSKAGKKH